MSFTVVSWDIDTSSHDQASEISGELTRQLARFRPARLMPQSAIISSDGSGGIDEIRDTLDTVSGRFPGQFFYVSVDVPDDSPLVEGIFPPAADLDGAHEITGSDRNPLPRQTLALAPSPALAAAPRGARGRRKGAAKGARTRGTKRRGRNRP